MMEESEIAVIFTSQRRMGDDAAYDAMATEMATLAAAQPGFRGLESARRPDGFGITVSYWADEASVVAWKANAAHLVAQRRGQETFYDNYAVRVARVTRSYQFPPCS